MTLGFFFFFSWGWSTFFFFTDNGVLSFFGSELHVHFYMPYTITSTVFLCAIMVGLSGVGGAGEREGTI